MRRFFLIFGLLAGLPTAARAEVGPVRPWFGFAAADRPGPGPPPSVPGEIPDRIPFFIGMPRPAPAAQSALSAATGPGRQCRAAVAAAERAAAIPPRLLQAIALVESGRTDADGRRRPWPWAVDADGTGLFFQTKGEAVAAVRRLRARGARSIDVGCLQVSLLHHPHAFASLDQAFDPAANATYAAGFLRRLFGQTHDWAAAAAAYHSQTPALAVPYRRKVMAAWTGLGGAPPVTGTAPPVAAGGGESGGGFASPFGAPVLADLSQPRLPAGFHIIRAAPGPGVTPGRSLAAYRARPIAINR